MIVFTTLRFYMVSNSEAVCLDFYIKTGNLLSYAAIGDAVVELLINGTLRIVG